MSRAQAAGHRTPGGEPGQRAAHPWKYGHGRRAAAATGTGRRSAAPSALVAHRRSVGRIRGSTWRNAGLPADHVPDLRPNCPWAERGRSVSWSLNPAQNAHDSLHQGGMYGGQDQDHRPQEIECRQDQPLGWCYPGPSGDGRQGSRPGKVRPCAERVHRQGHIRQKIQVTQVMTVVIAALPQCGRGPE